ncbi:hypothetical protein P3339_02245 [Microbulbifer sp. MLAF003]|uniref:immunoglobulin domain-containing protein n=1 Tax=unclassified Microbulbifer TaxID=2619833 RepID=UPI0024AC932B|nr:hypothetical protein [Microbulbifer sp. MLAF003]WHI51672.1 hypothetical protein P3339_02245 [Microbulbifer sp. MLAF003]
MATMPSSGQASSANLQSVFGQSGAGNTSQFYRGGSFVPNISQNNNIPTSGAADSADFYSATDYVAMGTPSLSGTTVKQNAGTGSVSCSTTLTCSQPSNGTGNFIYTWQKVSGTTLSVSANGRSVTLSRSDTGEITTSQYRCKVTDGVGTVYSNTVTITFHHYQFLPGNLPSSFSASAGSPTNAVARLEIARNGYIYLESQSSSPVSQGAWIKPASSTVGDKFQMRFDNASVSGDNSDISGASPSVGSVGTINGTRYAYRNRTSNGSYTCGVRVRIKLIGGSYLFDDVIGLKATKYSTVGMGIGVGMGIHIP